MDYPRRQQTVKRREPQVGWLFLWTFSHSRVALSRRVNKGMARARESLRLGLRNLESPWAVESLVMLAPMPTKHERAMACAGHILGVFGPMWLPLLAFAFFRPFSRFAARHALRAGLDNIILDVFLFLLTTAGVIWWIIQLFTTIANNQPFDFWQAITRFVIVVTLWLALQFWNMVQAVIWVHKAWRGEDPPMHRWLERVAPPALP